MHVVAHAVRSGIAALDVVTAALDTDPRTRDVDVVFARGPGEVARALAAADGPARSPGRSTRPTPGAPRPTSPGCAPTPAPRWRQQAEIAGERVELRRTRPARRGAGGAGSTPR
jgi:hypothetical protein